MSHCCQNIDDRVFTCTLMIVDRLTAKGMQPITAEQDVNASTQASRHASWRRCEPNRIKRRSRQARRSVCAYFKTKSPSIAGKGVKRTCRYYLFIFRGHGEKLKNLYKNQYRWNIRNIRGVDGHSLFATLNCFTVVHVPHVVCYTHFIIIHYHYH